MRKIKVGAIQPRYINTPLQFDFLNDDYHNSPYEITEYYIKEQLDVTLNLIELAGKDGCDIVTTSEDIAGTSNYATDITEKNIFPELLDWSVPYVEERLSEMSKKYGMYIVGCYNKRIGDKNYNLAGIFNRKGEICGEYRKTHMPLSEKWQLTEGDDLNVFELDFGKISVAICYDIMFQESMEVLALKGAEIIFHPTVGYGWYDSIGEATIRTRANDNSVYIVSSKNYHYSRAGKSSVVDFWGQVMVDAGFYENVIVTGEIDLDVKKTQPDWFYSTGTSGIADVQERNLKERRPDLYGSITENLHEKLPTPSGESMKKIFLKIKSGQFHW